MNIPIQTKPALWGALGGAIVLAVVGFSWGGWQTSSRADASASMRVDAAVIDALAPVCVAQFRRDAAADENLAALKNVDPWAQSEFIEKGGWATVADAKAPQQLSSIAKACADLLTSA